MTQLNAKQLRDLDHDEVIPEIKRYPVYLILDNIYDTYNIGGLFRLADALAITKLYICGDSETPPNIKIKRASIGTYKVVPWEYKNTVLEAIEEIKISLENTQNTGDDIFFERIREPLPTLGKEGPRESEKNDIEQLNKDKHALQVISIEQSPTSVPYTTIPYSTPVAFIVGNETTGVSAETMQASDYIAEIPMLGINKSFNVIVSASIVMSHAYNSLKIS